MLRTLLLLLTALMLVAPPRVEAARSRRSKRRLAKKLFKQAEVQYSLQRFEQARRGYERAYAVLPLPAFLFNIGQCHRMQGNYPKAVFYFSRYLGLARTSRSTAVVRTLLKQLNAVMEAQKRQAALKLRYGVSAEQSAEAARRILLEQRKLIATERLLLQQERQRLRASLQRMLARTKRPPPPVVTPVYKKWWFWTVIVGGVAAAVGASLGFTLGARTKWVDPAGSLGTLNRR
jgi:tetratricopeptide (TPR) repeat protein